MSVMLGADLHYRRDVRVCILGNLEVQGDAEAIPIESPKERAALEVLALRCPDLVPVDALVTALWGDDPPNTASKSLQSHLSRLRSKLGSEMICTEPGGYRLSSDPDDIDAHRFIALVRAGTQAVEAGDHPWACELLDRALDLWRGPPIADVAESHALTGQRARLEEVRLNALLAHADARLGLGEHREMVPRLEELVAEHPYDEALWARLAVALYRCDRRADALGALERVRTLLRRELGLDPSPELITLEHRILDDAPDLLAPRTPPRPHLPAALTSFVGREREIREVAKALQTHRLVTLLGPGGVGKSRLAVETARRIAHRFDHGVRWVDMITVSEPGEVAGRLATALGAAIPPGMSAEHALERHLGSRNLLLLVDNAERLTEEVGDVVVRLLGAAPGLTVLCTSRSPLDLTGEHRYRVPPLAAAEAGGDPRDGEAVRLFLDRLEDRQVSLGVEQLDAAVEACELVDRLPLGVELAAAASADSGMATALLELRATHGLVEDQPGHRPIQSFGDRGGLAAVLRSTTDLLDEEQREILGQLSVFVGDFDLDAAAAVCPRVRCANDLRKLCDLSLLAVTREPERRHRLLDTTRAFATGLVPDATLQGARSRHADHFRSLAVAAGERMETRDEPGWLDRLQADIANLEVALEWFSENEPARVLEFGRALGRYWFVRTDMAGALRRMSAIVETASAAADVTASELGWSLLRRGWPRFLCGDLEGGLEDLDRARDLLASQGDHAGVATTLTGHAHMILLGTGDTERALVDYRGAVEEARLADDDLLVGWALAETAQSLVLADRLDEEVLAMIEEASQIFDDAEDPFGSSHAAMDRMLAAFSRRDFDGMRVACTEGIAAQRAARNTMYEQILHVGLGMRHLWLGDTEAAAEEVAGAIRLAHRDGNLLQLAVALQAAATLEAAAGEDRTAARLWGAAGSLGPRWPLFERSYGEFLDPARQRLGHVWHEEESAGAATAPDEAVALALR